MEKINIILNVEYYPLFFRFLTKIKKEDVYKNKIILNKYDNKQIVSHVIPYYKPI